MTDKTMPERIFLQDGGDWEDTTWCKDRVSDGDVEYIRADLVKPSGGSEKGHSRRITDLPGQGENLHDPMDFANDAW